MKKYISYSVVAFFAATVVALAAPDKEAMMAKEKAAWQAFKDKKSDDFKNLLSADFMGVYSDGIQALQKEMDSMKTWDLKSFAFSDMKVVFPDADTATLTYKVKVEGTSNGKDASGTYNAGSVWKKHGGEWHAIFHTNMKEEAPAGPTAQ